MLNRAETNLADQENIEYVLVPGDGTLPLPDDSIDVVFPQPAGAPPRTTTPVGDSERGETIAALPFLLGSAFDAASL